MPGRKAVVIGCGRIGALLESDALRAKPATHAGMWQSTDGVDLVGLMDSSDANLDQASALFPGIPVFRDAAAMLNQCEPDIVSIATHSDSHGRYIIQCAQAGVPAIVSEKPLDAKLDIASAAIAQVRNSQSALFVNHVRRYSPLLRRLASRIFDGEFGAFLHAQGCYVHGLNATGTHMIDLCRMLLNSQDCQVTAVQGSVSRLDMLHPDDDPNINATLHLSGGGTITLSALSMRDYDIFEAVFYFRKARVVLSDMARRVQIFYPISAANKTGFTTITQQPDETEDEATVNWFDELAVNVMAVLDGREHPIASGEDSLATLSVVDAIRASAMNGSEMVAVPQLTPPGQT